MNPLLEIEDLSISFQSSKEKIFALQDFDMSLYPGEIIGIIGESGSGKTALTSSIMRLLPPSGKIEKGTITFEDVNLLKRTPKQMQAVYGNDISMIFQDPMTALTPTLKIGSQIIEVIQRHKNSSEKEARFHAIQLLHEVGMPDAHMRLEQYPHQLSGGLRQRVLIAIAIANNPKLIIADEPTTSLDMMTAAQIGALLYHLSRSRGSALIIISHDLRFVSGLCDRLYVLYAGKLVESGPTSDIFDTPAHPYTRGLIDSIPSMTTDRKKPLKAIKGTISSQKKPFTECPFFSRCNYAMHICKDEVPTLNACSKNHRCACFLHAPGAEKRLEEFTQGLSPIEVLL